MTYIQYTLRKGDLPLGSRVLKAQMSTADWRYPGHPLIIAKGNTKKMLIGKY
jgi:hypothetical protein